MAAPYYVYGGNLLNREKYTSVVRIGDVEKRYFSSIDTDVYFGDTLIDEMVAFDFIIEEKKIPIYGYNTYVPKRIITGQKTIQGSFAINFTRTFNLKYILDEVAESLYANDYEVVQYFCNDNDAALFNKGFDITLSYGDAKDDSGFKSYNACTQTLVGCYITSYRQAFDTSGEPILDMYTFIAKDLIVQSDIAVNSDSDNPNIAPQDDPPTRKEPEPSAYKVSHMHNKYKKDQDAVFNYCKQYPDTLGILINPVCDCINGQYRISMSVNEINNKLLEIESITIDIIDNSVQGSYTFKLNKKMSKHQYYYELTGTHVNVGKRIESLLTSSDDGIECHVEIHCEYNGTSYNVEHSTTIELGTGLKPNGNTDYDALSY